MTTDRSTHACPPRSLPKRTHALPWLGRALITGALLLPLAACGGGRMSGSPHGYGDIDSPYGSFLSARHARISNQNGLAADYYLKAMHEDPGNALLTQGAFLALLADGRVAEATNLAPLLLQHNPGDYLPRMTVAASKMMARDYDGVLKMVEAGPNSGIHAAFNPLLSAFAYAGKGDSDKAMASLQKLERHPLLAGVVGHLKPLLLDMMNQAEPAEAAYREAIEGTDRPGTRLVDAYARFLERHGRVPEARRLIDQQLVQNPDNPILLAAVKRLKPGSAQQPAPLLGNPVDGLAEAMFASASAFGRGDGGELAELHLQLSLFLRPDLDDARMLLADIYESRDRWQDALRVYSAVSTNSPYAETATLRSAWCISELGRTEDAVRVLKATAAEDPKSPRPLLTLADLFRQRENWVEAAKYYTAALANIDHVEPRHWTIFFGRGIALERSKQWERAEADMLKALELQPDQPSVLNYLGYSWVDMHRNLEQATRMIERAVSLRPNDGAIVDSLGWALYRQGRYGDAVSQLERAVELRGGDAVITDHLGDAYWRVGRHEEARFQWRRALGLKPDQDLQLQLQRKVDSGLDPVANNN